MCVWIEVVLHPVALESQRGSWRVDGKKVGRKLSVPVAARANLGGHAGSVGIWRKGYSNYCRLCPTIVKAISAAAGISLYLFLIFFLICFQIYLILLLLQLSIFSAHIFKLFFYVD